ncbi:dTDP-4-dehydrorhamnose reductase [Oceanirhabdus sp. W0125-5]|uniref:dTDP-4-dehydrorhamnose reductase n=1 Tax=Oceanirhabdus sp. W0125-5 TaxID=2999116 RepID=UPI0022F2B2C5|nr:dTDP-4-dehydrorhamnose reductase [Oceanirhabdus sp. W0125-5]WBW98660.1 dTDP-4-dehydrorhamnose reductase [Oceanirhabdus sp. W0125-5]
MKVLITGSNGQLGSQLLNIIKRGKSELGEIDIAYKTAEIKGVDVEELDITDLYQIKKIIHEYKPNIVINPAAYTNVDECEDNQELAFKVNSLGTKNLARVCEEVGAKLVHISTDYVFEGNGQVPYREYDVPHPVSVYGKTKWLGEEYIKQFCNKYFIVRTSWLYGYNGKNFVKTIMKYAKEKGHLNVVNDQRGNPTNAEDLAHHILKIALTEDYGVYHCTGEGECTWYDFAYKIVEYAGIECTVSPVTSDEFKQKAKRPSYSSLDNMMLRCGVGNEMREWTEALKEFIANI